MQTLPLHIRQQPNLDIDLSSQKHRLTVMTEPLQFIIAKSNRSLSTWDSFRELLHCFLLQSMYKVIDKKGTFSLVWMLLLGLQFLLLFCASKKGAISEIN